MENVVEQKTGLKIPLWGWALLAILSIVLAQSLLTYAGNIFTATATVNPNPLTLWTQFQTNSTNQISSPTENPTGLTVNAGDTITANLNETNSANNQFIGNLSLTIGDGSNDFNGSEITNINIDGSAGNCNLAAGNILCILPITINADTSIQIPITGQVAFSYNHSNNLQISGQDTP